MADTALAAIFTSLGGLISKPTACFMSKALKNLNVFSAIFFAKTVRRWNCVDLISGSNLNGIDARMINTTEQLNQ